MIRFFKEIYLTAFAIIIKLPSRRDNTSGKIGVAITVITLIACLNLAGISSCIETLAHKKELLNFPKLVNIMFFFAVLFMNQYVLVTRGYGIKFEREFGNLKKSRRILLVTSCVILLLGTIYFCIYSGLAYRHFIGVQ